MPEHFNKLSAAPKRPLIVFLCHIMPVGYAHADRDPVPQGDDIPQGDDVRGLYVRLTQDGVDA
jgi:hypothetical protein